MIQNLHASQKNPSLDLVLKDARMVWGYTHSVTRYIKFIGRSFLKWKISTDWYHFLEAMPALKQAPDDVKSVLADKIHRPYSRCNLTTCDRISMLKDHYDLLCKILPSQVVLRLVTGERLVLATLISRKHGEAYDITLSREMLSQHQGELTFLLIEQTTQVLLARLVANLSYSAKGEPMFTVCGMQGPGPVYKQDIVKATRSLDGLRPKRAILEAACAFAEWMKAEKLIAMSKNNHVSQSKSKWRKRVVADYDSFWQELSPENLENGDYILQNPLPRRNLEEVLPKKRKEWLFRYEIIEDIRQKCISSLETIASETATVR